MCLRKAGKSESLGIWKNLLPSNPIQCWELTRNAVMKTVNLQNSGRGRGTHTNPPCTPALQLKCFPCTITSLICFPTPEFQLHFEGKTEINFPASSRGYFRHLNLSSLVGGKRGNKYYRIPKKLLRLSGDNPTQNWTC